MNKTNVSVGGSHAFGARGVEIEFESEICFIIFLKKAGVVLSFSGKIFF